MVVDERRWECTERFLEGKEDRTPIKHGYRHLQTDGETLWVYGDHYVGAQKTDIDFGGRKIIFVNTHKYSPTTVSIMSIVSSAIKDDNKYDIVEFCESLKPENVVEFQLSKWVKNFSTLGIPHIVRDNFIKRFSKIFPDYDVKAHVGDAFEVNYSSLLDIQKAKLSIKEKKWEALKLLIKEGTEKFDEEAIKLNIHLTRVYLQQCRGMGPISDRFTAKDIILSLLKRDKDIEYAILQVHHEDWRIRSAAQNILENAA